MIGVQGSVTVETPEGLNAQYSHDFSEEGLRNSGYTLRNYLTLFMYLRIREILGAGLEQG